MDEPERTPIAGANWLAAVIAPWTVSPHPNFGEDDVDGSSLLGLIAEYRPDELDRFAERIAGEQLGWESALISAARSSLESVTQSESANRLNELSSTEELPDGARAAAALFASVAYVEIERIETSLEMLRTLLADLETNTPRSSSHQLIRRVLRLQLLMRLVESGDQIEATQQLQRLEEQNAEPISSLEDFRVSAGISWSADRVQLDIHEAICAHTARLRMRLEGFSGTTWVDIVKSRPTWIDVRVDWRDSERDARFRRRTFENLAPTGFNKVVYGGEVVPGVRAALGSLLQSELNGDFGEVLANREALAHLLALGRQSVGPHEAMSEALRLMRSTGAKDGLLATIALTRADGPVSALLQAVRLVLDRPSFPERCDSSDVRLIEGAFDLLPPAETARIISALEGFLDRQLTSASFDEIRLGIRTLGLFVANGVDPNRSASAVLDAVVRSNTSPYSVASEILNFLGSIDSSRLAKDCADAWRAWGRGLLDDTDTEVLGRQILKEFGSHDADLAKKEIDDEAIVEFLSNEDASVAPDRVDEMVNYCRKSLERLSAEARRGMLSGYARDPGELAVLVSVRTNDPRLWSDISSVVCDMNISADHKTKMVERLTQNIDELPDNVVRQIRACADDLIRQSRAVTPMAFESRSPFPEALALASLLQAISTDTALSAATQMANDPLPAVRRDACAVIPSVIAGTSAADWGQVLLLQMTRDNDLVVRADAIRELVLTLPYGRNLSAMVVERLVEVLGSDSVRMPLFALHGLQQVDENRRCSKVFDPLHNAVRSLAQSHPSSTVRGAAEIVLENNRR